MGMSWVAYRRDDADARAVLEDADRLDELLEAEDDARSVDLDKAWHGIHWLLTGSVDPTLDAVSGAVLGGEPLGEDLGYGPPRLLSAADVSAVAAAMHEVAPDVLRARMDGPAMEAAGVYPSIWDEPDVFETYLAPAFESLREFYAAAADAGEAVIQVIC